MYWQEISGSWLLIPRQPKGIIHFLGGAFVATAPQLSYRFLLEELAKKSYLIIATPFLNTLDHVAIARDVLNRFENLLLKLELRRIIEPGYIPIYGLGHSLGCKLHLLIGSIFAVERAGNILISFNNYAASDAIPLVEQLEINPNLKIEFIPTPKETTEIIANSYQIRRNLLIKFNNDSIDQTLILNPVLETRFPEMISVLKLPGNHLTPLSQDLQWQSEIFSPLDNLAKWLKQELSRDLEELKKEILRWLNPTLY